MIQRCFKEEKQWTPYKASKYLNCELFVDGSSLSNVKAINLYYAKLSLTFSLFLPFGRNPHTKQFTIMVKERSCVSNIIKQIFTVYPDVLTQPRVIKILLSFNR